MPKALEICEVKTKAQKKHFLRLPFDIYADTPQWTPPLQGEEEKLAGFDGCNGHPFYYGALARQWVAYDNDKPVGRIVGIVNQHFNVHYYGKRKPAGFFGFFECNNNPSVAFLLFDTVRGWLKDFGFDQMYGPVNPSMNYTCGVLTDGFDKPTSIMMPYNHGYYPTLFDVYGFTTAQNLFTYYADYTPNGNVPTVDDLLNEKLVRVADIAKRMFGITTRPVTKATFDSDVRDFMRLYNESMQAGWMFVPLSDAEMDHMAKQLSWLIEPALATVATLEGKTIGILLNLPDINPSLRKVKGKLFPFGWVEMLRASKKATHARCICTNITPEYQMRGIAGILAADSILPAIRRGMRSVEFSWVLESNTLACDTLRKNGTKLVRTHRMYVIST